MSVRQSSVSLPYSEQAQLRHEDGESWIVRARNFAIVYTRGAARSRYVHRLEAESFVYIASGSVTLVAGQVSATLAGEALAVVPPGDLEIVLHEAGEFIQVVTADEAIVGKAANASVYADGAPEVAPVEPWPMPVKGYGLRTYSMDDIYATGGMVNAFRTRKLMIVPYARFLEPRDETRLTPHAHADFEQGSVALEGEWVHHLRVPWGPDRRTWQADQHLEIGSPSTTIIPAGMIHTSQGLSGEGMRLIDVFSPPRMDFSLRPGVVRNADDYPMPAVTELV